MLDIRTVPVEELSSRTGYPVLDNPNEEEDSYERVSVVVNEDGAHELYCCSIHGKMTEDDITEDDIISTEEKEENTLQMLLQRIVYVEKLMGDLIVRMSKIEKKCKVWFTSKEQ